MKIKLLTPSPEKLIPIILATGDEVFGNPSFMVPDLVVSYNSRRIIPPAELALCPHINLHISLLPYNRGANPNFWSWFDHTPKGVTIHYMDSGVDTGPILNQLTVQDSGTLRSTYDFLHAQLLVQFGLEWPRLRSLPSGQPQELEADGVKRGSSHRSADKDPFFSKLPLGWDTPVSHVEEMGESWHAGASFWRKYNDEILAQREETK